MHHQTEEDRSLFSIDPGSLLVIVYIGLVVMVLLLSAFSVSYASIEEKPVPSITINEVTRGELLIPAEQPGQYRCAPILSQHADIDISGMTARTKLIQKFKNPGSEWIEASYVYPLPDESAVDTLYMIVGERRISGIIKEKEEAKAIYKKAAAEGKKASLVVQKRPNIFVTSVANIGPGEEVTIEIQYQQKVMLKDGVFSLRFPMAITPRYQPLGGGSLQELSSPSLSSFTEGGWSAGDGEESDVHLQTLINVVLASGFDIGSLRSLYHGIIDDEKEGVHTIRLNGIVKADRDFVLEWEAKNSKEIQAALFTEQMDSNQYVLIMLTPPTVKNRAHVPRELVYILDISGSMSGKSIREAKKSLLYSLDDLHDYDRFNIIVFNNNAGRMFEKPVAATSQNIEGAKKFIDGLEAEGGTEMAPALELAFENKTPELMRQIVFITDGAVGNELELFKLIQQNLGDSRLFTVGIGSAPNMYFMSRAASFGRGTYTAIGDLNEVNEKMGLLLHKLSSPVSQNLKLVTDNGQMIESYPSPIPDLYMGEPLVITAKVPDDTESLVLSGTLAGQPWSSSLAIKKGAEKTAIAKVWARDKIRHLMDSRVGGNPIEEIKNEIVATALKYHLVSQYTSLVAVEEKVSRPENARLQQLDVAKKLPHGMQLSSIYGGGAKTATPASLLTLLGVICLSISLALFLYGRFSNTVPARRRIR